MTVVAVKPETARAIDALRPNVLSLAIFAVLNRFWAVQSFKVEA